MQDFAGMSEIYSVSHSTNGCGEIFGAPKRK